MDGICLFAVVDSPKHLACIFLSNLYWVCRSRDIREYFLDEGIEVGIERTFVRNKILHCCGNVELPPEIDDCFLQIIFADKRSEFLVALPRMTIMVCIKINRVREHYSIRKAVGNSIRRSKRVRHPMTYSKRTV